MNFQLRIDLGVSAAQVQALQALQAAFAQVCNALAPTVQSTRVWNRVALHHLAYKTLRGQFPHLGSQMVCNAIYAVSRTCRQVFQTPHSPFALEKLGNDPLPLLHFAPDGPVFFDRHTLSVKAGLLSLYTLEGRMRFEQVLRPEDEALFHAHKLREVVLARDVQSGTFRLTLWLVDEAAQADAAVPLPPPLDSMVDPAGEGRAPAALEAVAVNRSVAQDEAWLAVTQHAAVVLPAEAMGVFAEVAPGALPAFVQVHGVQD